MNQKVTISVVALAVMLTAGFGYMATASAQGAGHGRQNIVERLAQRFNLNPTDVQTFFDEMHAEHVAQHGDRIDSKLDALVASGELTAEQKNAIVAKMAELQVERAAMKDQVKDLSPSERRELMQTKKAELEAWAEALGIDLKDIFPLIGGRPGMRGHGHGSHPIAPTP